MIFAKTLLFTLLVPGTVLVLVPHLIARSAGWSGPPRGLAWLGLLMAVLGGLLYFWCAWHFAVTGHGTPNPLDPPRAVVARGPYRFVRNPMYLGGLLVLVGEAFLYETNSLFLYALGIWLVWHLLVVLYEEPRLEAAFGETYRRYKQVVPRWLPSRKPAG